MSPEMKDQATEAKAEGQSEEVLTPDQLYDRGWEQVELLTQQEAEAKAKPSQPKEPKKTDTGTDDSTSKPFMVLKVGGKEYPVKTEDELIELAQKGADYTKKTQVLADDRRDAEAKVKQETERITDATEKMAELAERLMKAGVLPKSFDVEEAKKSEGPDKAADGSISPELAKVFEEFQLDPANAYPHEKRQIEELHNLRQQIKELRDERVLERQEKAEKIISDTISKERESHPFDDVVDDQGNDITRDKIKAIVATKAAIAGVDKPNQDQVLGWLRDAVKELHYSQKGNGEQGVSDDMDPAEFVKKFPGLAQKVQSEAAQKERSERSKLPPSLTPGKREVDSTKRPYHRVVKEGSKSSDDWIEEGFKDPDIIKAISGE